MSSIESIYVEVERTGGTVRAVLDRDRGQLALTFGFMHEGKFVPKRDEFINLRKRPYLWNVYDPETGWNKRALAVMLD